METRQLNILHKHLSAKENKLFQTIKSVLVILMKETICSNIATFLLDLKEICQFSLLLLKKNPKVFHSVLYERNRNCMGEGYVEHGFPVYPFWCHFI